MTQQELHEKIFREGSKTYYNSSRFFPKEVREDIFALYAFVRVADNFVDAVPQQAKEFHAFCDLYRRGLAGESVNDPVISPFLALMKKHSLPKEWVDAFLHSMALDLTKAEYDSHEELLVYIYGSAEVIGLFMAKIMGLAEESYHAAQMLGRAMQYINFIRDIDEDNALGRRYLPLSGTTLPDLKAETVARMPDEFCRFLRSHTELYFNYYLEAKPGYRYLPKKVLPPVRTAMNMYNWTAKTIMKNPLVVFRKKVKPSKLRIILAMLFNQLFPGRP